MNLSAAEQELFDKARRGDWDPFTSHFFKLPMSGTWFTPEDRVENYEALYDVWRSLGQPDLEFESAADGVSTKFRVSWDVGYYGDNPIFLLPHGFKTLPWLVEFLNPAIPVGAAITGAGTGKTAGVGIVALMWCAVHPGFRFLNVAPTGAQAELILGEVEKWAGSQVPFRKFIEESRATANKLWVNRPHPTLTIEVYDGYPSTFVCQTVKNNARGVLGGERDFINCDEAQLLEGIDEAKPILATRLRGTRSTGDLRWGMLRWISNPGDNPELTALLQEYKELGPKKAVVLEEIDTSVNVYITKRQREVQRISLTSQRAKDRWHGGLMLAAAGDREFDEVLLANCRDDSLTKITDEIGRFDDVVGLVEYELSVDYGSTYVVVGDVGKGDLHTLSSQNVPTVMVFDVTSFLNRPIILSALYWFSGNGTYETFISKVKHAMLRYQAVAYYDATNIQSAFEDIQGDSFDKWPTTPMSFGGLTAKKWSVAITVKLMQDGLFRWPYIKGLWHQASVFTMSRTKQRADDLMASLLVFALALRYENTLWTKFIERYDWRVDEKDGWNYAGNAPPDPDLYTPARGRHDRILG